MVTTLNQRDHKLGMSPFYSGKEDEWSGWSLETKNYVSLLSTHVPALLAGAEDTATTPDMGMMSIRATLTDEGARSAEKLFFVLVMNVKGPARNHGEALHQCRQYTGCVSRTHQAKRSKHTQSH